MDWKMLTYNNNDLRLIESADCMCLDFAHPIIFSCIVIQC